MFSFLVRCQTQNTKHKQPNNTHTHIHRHAPYAKQLLLFQSVDFAADVSPQKLWCTDWSYSNSDNFFSSAIGHKNLDRAKMSQDRVFSESFQSLFRVFGVSLWLDLNSCVNSCHRRTQTLTMDGAQRWPFGRAADFVDSTQQSIYMLLQYTAMLLGSTWILWYRGRTGAL